MESKFQIDDLVWAKMKGHPLWPGQIIEPLPDNKPPKNKNVHCVFFFGSKNFAWIAEECIIPHSEKMLKNMSKKKSTAFKNAVNALIKVYNRTEKDEQDDSSEEDMSENDLPQAQVVKSAKNVFHESKRKGKKRSVDSEDYESSVCKLSPKLVRLAASESPLFTSTPSSSSSDFTSINTDSFRKSLFSNDALKSCKKIGFIGLGKIGSGIVRTFLRHGANVMVWNRTESKCQDLVIRGATQAASPSDLVVSCDITFCCVSNSDASKALIFGNSGILNGLDRALQLGLRNKGFVEMTSIDPETSQDIFEAINKKGAKYLEAPHCGTSADAENGKLLILAAGDRELYLHCEKYFHVISKRAHFMSCEAGHGNKMSLLQSSLAGVVYTAIGETLSLAKLLNINEIEFLDVLAKGPLQFEDVVEKAERMIKCEFETITPLKHMQKCLKLALNMGHELSQPLYVTAAANEIYKHARLLQYSDSDVCAVYQGIRY